ncbi:MAG: DUF4230 domain-containing protein [Acidobacteria bacterium]|nr:DUF4230 domain-containing protein [Acidobacteriota bacterium]
MELERRIRKRWIVLTIVLVMIVLTPLMMRIAFPPHEVAEAIVDATVGKQEKPLDISAIVTNVSELNRLETAKMRVMHVSQIRQSYGIIPDMIAGDSLTLMAVGEVFAGVDLSRLAPADVRKEGEGGVVIQLPRAEVLVTRLDNEETKVLDRKTGALRRADLGLEGRARAYAESGIRDEALKKGILDLASTNAERRIGELARSLGATSVRFERATRPSSTR